MTRKPNTGERKGRDLLYQRSSGCCEICGKGATNVHHRKNRSGGGTWAVSNLLHLCGSGTTGCHGLITCQPWEVDARGSGYTVHFAQDPAKVPVWLGQQWVLLDDMGGMGGYTDAEDVPGV